jgi:hypothetical protein
MRRLALLALVLCGCTVLRDELGTRIPWEASLYSEGETHYRDVLKDLGCPLRVSRHGTGVAFLYEYAYVKEGQLGLSYDDAFGTGALSILEWIKFSFGTASADREALLMTFDRDGILESERFVSWNQKLGTGFSIQFIVDVGSVVDTTAATAEVDPNDWGAMMLRPLPQTLNAAQNIDDGRYGFEQRGTPRKVGQRTLEMREKPMADVIPFIGDD